jgi:hypothetical protein
MTAEMPLVFDVKLVPRASLLYTIEIHVRVFITLKTSLDVRDVREELRASPLIFSITAHLPLDKR